MFNEHKNKQLFTILFLTVRKQSQKETHFNPQKSHKRFLAVIQSAAREEKTSTISSV